MARVDATFQELRDGYEQAARGELGPLLAAADVAVSGDAFTELAALMLRLMTTVAVDIGARVARALGDDGTMWNPAMMDRWLAKVSRNVAVGEWDQARERLATDDVDPEAVRTETRDRLALDSVATPANFAANDAAQATGAMTKMWKTTSSNPRSSHAALNGVIVAVGSLFPNGMAYPRGGGPPAQTANCKCALVLMGR